MTANLFKVGSKRRRTKQEIQDFKLEMSMREEAQAEKDQKIKALEGQVERYEADVEPFKKAYYVCQQLLDTGAAKIGEDGDFTLI